MSWATVVAANGATSRRGSIGPGLPIRVGEPISGRKPASALDTLGPLTSPTVPVNAMTWRESWENHRTARPAARIGERAVRAVSPRPRPQPATFWAILRTGMRTEDG